MLRVGPVRKQGQPNDCAAAIAGGYSAACGRFAALAPRRRSNTCFR